MIDVGGSFATVSRTARVSVVRTQPTQAYILPALPRGHFSIDLDGPLTLEAGPTRVVDGTACTGESGALQPTTELLPVRTGRPIGSATAPDAVEGGRSGGVADADRVAVETLPAILAANAADRDESVAVRTALASTTLAESVENVADRRGFRHVERLGSEAV